MTGRRRATFDLIEAAAIPAASTPWTRPRDCPERGDNPHARVILRFATGWSAEPADVRERSLHRHWMFHGFDGAMALRSLILLRAPSAIDLARETLWRDDPASSWLTSWPIHQPVSEFASGCSWIP